MKNDKIKSDHSLTDHFNDYLEFRHKEKMKSVPRSSPFIAMIFGGALVTFIFIAHQNIDRPIHHHHSHQSKHQDN